MLLAAGMTNATVSSGRGTFRGAVSAMANPVKRRAATVGADVVTAAICTVTPGDVDGGLALVSGELTARKVQASKSVIRQLRATPVDEEMDAALLGAGRLLDELTADSAALEAPIRELSKVVKWRRARVAKAGERTARRRPAEAGTWPTTRGGVAAMADAVLAEGRERAVAAAQLSFRLDVGDGVLDCLRELKTPLEWRP